MQDFKPLSGIRVLDFTHVIAGPLASFYMAQLGADVIKVEAPNGGDVMRRTPQGAASFLALNAGKQVRTIDLATPAGRDEALQLAAESDVLLDSLRPGALERHGLGPAAVQALQPRLIYCAISGWGRHGPMAECPAYDHVIQAATGMMLTAGREGDDPIKIGFPVVDAATGILGALAIVCALRERDATGRGRIIDASMAAAAMQLMYPFACGALTAGITPPRMGNQGFSGSPAADIFRTLDGWIALGANTPRQFIALLGVLKRPEIAADPAFFDPPLSADAPAEFLRARDPQRLQELLAQIIAAWRASDLEAACAEARVPAARVRGIGEFASQPHLHYALGALQLGDGPVKVVSPGLGFRVE
jgi:crotonobetainyl-CoA:carnitine CoA-transferase CaiB-like acyl-CoA transferase